MVGANKDAVKSDADYLPRTSSSGIDPQCDRWLIDVRCPTLTIWQMVVVEADADLESDVTNDFQVPRCGDSSYLSPFPYVTMPTVDFTRNDSDIFLSELDSKFEGFLIRYCYN